MVFCRKCYSSITKIIEVTIYPCRHAPVIIKKEVCGNCGCTVFTHIPT